MTVPRGRITGADGRTTEFHSQLLPRYARRTREIDEAILSCYLGGVNSRRIRTALKPLLGERHLSKSAVSRIVGRLKALFATWQGRDLSAERYPMVFLDGFHLKVRVARRVVSVPVLAALGVTETGQKCLLTLRVAASEASGDVGRRGHRSAAARSRRAAAADCGRQRRAQARVEAVGGRARAALHDAQTGEPADALPQARPGGNEAGLPSPALRHRWPRRARGLRGVREEMVHRSVRQSPSPSRKRGSSS